MKRIGFIFDKVCSFENLNRAARKAMRGKKNKNRVARFYFNLEYELLEIQKELLSHTYNPLPYRCFFVYEPKQRYICAADFRDRVVHHALCNHLEPIFERIFIYDSYACRENKGTHKAVKRVQSFARNSLYFFKADVKKFFESIDHKVLKQLFLRKFKDKRLLDVIEIIIDHPVPGYTPGKGLAIGNLTSQWWANYYLNALDHYIKEELGVRYYVRYMDDFIILDNDKSRLHLLRAHISDFLKKELVLELKDSACMIAPVHEGIPFLGFRIFPHILRLNHKGVVRFKRKLREKERLFAEGLIEEEELLRSASSILGHVQHGNTLNLREKIFYNRIVSQ